ncbi:MAG: outer membrane beta-barrel protein [Flavobacteriales bacterium]
MKKLLFMLIAAFVSTAAFSQTFEQGSNRLHLGVGFGSAYAISGATSYTPPIHLSFEHGISEKIGVGALIGYTGAKTTVPFFGDIKYSYIIVGARGQYHFLSEDKYDVYGGAMLGYNIASVKWDNNTTSTFGVEPTAASSVAFGAFVGGRYNFSEKLAVFGELGYSIAWISAGICFNLN